MSGQERPAALAAGTETDQAPSSPQNGAQRCVRRPASTWSRCRCPNCATRNARLSKLNRLGRIDHAAIATSRARAYQRLDEWVEAGWEALAIASATGLSHLTAQDLARELGMGHRRRLTHASVRAILTATRPTAGRVGAHGTRRRLQALTWMGWGLDALSQHTAIPVMTLSNARSGNATVTAHVANAVADLYERLQNTHGQAPQAAATAARRGWAPPAAWDEDTIDDPHAVPLGLPGTGNNLAAPTDDVVLDRIRDLHRAGYSDPEIATRLDRTPDGIQKLRHRYGIRRAA